MDIGGEKATMEDTNKMDKVKEYLDKGIEASKDAFTKGMDLSKKALSKASDAVQDFGDKSVIRMERHQAEQKRNELIRELGNLAVDCFIKNQETSLNIDDEKVAVVIKEITRLNGEIERRTEVLNNKSDVNKNM